MAKRRPSGDGMVRKREDGRWEGRIVIGHKSNGDSIFRYIYADTQKELTAKLRQNIDAYQFSDEDLRRRRAESVQNVKKTNGRISLEQRVRGAWEEGDEWQD